MSSPRIDNKDFDIILALIQYPNSTDLEITEVLNNLDNKQKEYVNTTVHRRIKKLEEQEIITGAYAEINYGKIGLERHSFLVTFGSPNTSDNIKIFSKFCDEYPYTNFRNLTYGAINGMYVIFTIPKLSVAEYWLIESLQHLQTKGIIKSYTHFPRLKKVISSKGNLNHWDPNTHRWDVDLDQIAQVLTNSDPIEEPPVTDDDQSILDDLSTFDLILIREMMNDARRSQKEILDDILSSADYINERDEIPASKQSISRRISNLREQGVFHSYSLYYDRSSFGIFNQLLFIAKNIELDLWRLRNIIEKNLLPFDCALFVIDEKLIFWINLPPIEALDLTELFTAHLTDLQINFFGRKPFSYFLWHKNYDTATKSWKSDEDWMKNMALDALNI